MEYVELPAPPPLDELVHCFWFLRGTFPDTDTQTIVADGRRAECLQSSVGGYAIRMVR